VCDGNSNPVKLVFIDILRKEINVLRALRKGGYVKGAVTHQPWSLRQYDPTFCGWYCCLPCLCRRCACCDPHAGYGSIAFVCRAVCHVWLVGVAVF